MSAWGGGKLGSGGYRGVEIDKSRIHNSSYWRHYFPVGNMPNVVAPTI